MSNPNKPRDNSSISKVAQLVTQPYLPTLNAAPSLIPTVAPTLEQWQQWQNRGSIVNPDFDIHEHPALQPVAPPNRTDPQRFPLRLVDPQ